MFKIYRAAIFDLDGVIVDTAKYHFLAWKKLADHLQIPFTEKENEMFKGVSRRRCLEILLDLGKMEVNPLDFERWLVEKNQDYLELIDNMDASEILPHVPQVLEFLEKHDIPIALGSASKNAVPILEKTGLRRYFKVVMDGNHVAKAKPNPEVFLKAAEALQVKSTKCVVFEDAVAGIEAAKNADMLAIGIGDSFTLEKADYVFRDFTEIKRDFLIKIFGE